MTYPFDMAVEGALPGFFITGINPIANPQSVINEKPPMGLLDKIIEKKQAWDVTFNWCVGGPVADAMGPCQWRLCVYLLRLSAPGGAILVNNPPTGTLVNYNTGTPGPDNYSVKVPIKAGAVPDGVYELHTSVDIVSGAIIPVTLFGDGPTMKFYTA